MLVDLTAMKVTIRDPEMPTIEAVHEVSYKEPSFVGTAQEDVLGPFERLCAQKSKRNSPMSFIFAI